MTTAPWKAYNEQAFVFIRADNKKDESVFLRRNIFGADQLCL